jgi:hypothetical protein
MDNLLKAYSETDFKVYDPSITIKIGIMNPDLDKLLKQYDVREWAYITAWNPYSVPTSIKTNEEKNLQLKIELSNYIILEGEGVGTDPSWMPEKSFLVLGISKEQAIDLGRKYQQNAIVLGDLNSTPTLLWIS